MNVLHETPCGIAPDIDSVQCVSVGQGSNISPEVFATELVVQQLLKRKIVLSLETGAIFSHIEGRAAIPITKPLD